MKSYKNIMAIFLFGLFAAGCLSGENGVDGENLMGNEPLLIGYNKIYLDSAIVDDLALYKVACPGKRICIQICHVPPGNPKAAHDKVLPVQATKAHLGHGDYLGLCHSEDGSGSDIEAPGDGGDDDTGEVFPPPEEPGDDTGDDSEEPSDDIPAWCLPFVEYDSDCDGFYDDTGDPYF